MLYDCAVIGSGPGGLISALYLKRFLRSVVLIGAGQPRVLWAPRIRNLVGYDRGIPGRELHAHLLTQVKGCGLQMRAGEARIQRDRGKVFRIQVGSESIRARKVILATGMEDLQPEIANFAELRARGLLAYCPICDGYEQRAKTIAVLVKDETGLAKIPFIARYTRKLWVIHVGEKPLGARARGRLERLGVRIVHGVLESIEARSRGEGIDIRLRGQRLVRVGLAYVELGFRVRDSAFRDLTGLKRTEDGFLLTSSHQETSIPGLYAVGDCVLGLSQVSVAVGQAAIAATHAHNSLGF